MASTSSRTTRVDRRETARQLLQKELEQLPPEEREVVERFISRRQVARNVGREFHQTRTLGERIADRVAQVGGSWRFILCFFFLLVLWMVANSMMLAKAFDPYPYILLNLFLSMLAAIQAPIILMSQNRQSQKDRITAEHDYEINLKAELEIMLLHDKLDALRERDILARTDAIDAQLKQLCSDVSELKARKG